MDYFSSLEALPDSAFFHTIAGGLAAHVDKQYGEYLLADDCLAAKDEDALRK